MLQASTDLHAVQRILGHRNPQTTMRTYGHLQQAYLHEQIARMSMTQKAAPTTSRPKSCSSFERW
jgi:site-specific recombinase XerC